jgi:hypothetical protein
MAAMTDLPSLAVLAALLRIDLDDPDDATDVEALVALLVYDKRDYTFRGTIDAASIRIWLRDPVP